MYFPQMEVVGDIGNGIWQIMERLKDWTPTWDLRHAPGQRISFLLSVCCDMLWQRCEHMDVAETKGTAVDVRKMSGTSP